MGDSSLESQVELTDSLIAIGFYKNHASL